MFRELAIGQIRRLPELQARAALNTDRIEQYAEAYRNKEEMPHLIVWKVDGEFLLTQGFHRVAAAEAAGIETLLCNCKDGTLLDAIWDAATSNKEGDHGTLYRSNADKRRAVELAIKARPKMSNLEIARCVFVSDRLVGIVRSTLKDSESTSVREGKDGREINTANIGKKKAKKADPDPPPRPPTTTVPTPREEPEEEPQDCGPSEEEAAEANDECLESLTREVLDWWAEHEVTTAKLCSLLDQVREAIWSEYQ